MSINERFETIIKVLYAGNKRAFATAIGISPTVVENVVGTRQGKPSFDVLEKVCAKANISSEWLLLGKGDMLQDMFSFRAKSKSDTDNMLNIDFGTSDTSSSCIGTTCTTRKNIPFAETVCNDKKAIPLVTQMAAAGFGNSDFSIAEDDVKEYYVVPKFKHTHVDFMIEVSGLSMYPHYNPGDVIACSILRNTQFIQWNKCHVIATREQGILVKRLMPGDDKQHLRAVSDNQEYPPFEIPVDEITGIAIVVGSVCLE